MKRTRYSDGWDEDRDEGDDDNNSVLFTLNTLLKVHYSTILLFTLEKE